MPILELLSLLILVAIGWFFLDGFAARDAGVTAARKACRIEGLQFLDDTVALNGLRLLRNDDGDLRIQRTYAFEYSETGDNRCPGSVTLLGHEVVMLYTGQRTLAEDTPSLH